MPLAARVDYRPADMPAVCGVAWLYGPGKRPAAWKPTREWRKLTPLAGANPAPISMALDKVVAALNGEADLARAERALMQMAGTVLPIQPAGIALIEPLLRVSKSSGLRSSWKRCTYQQDAKLNNYRAEVQLSGVPNDAWVQRVAA